MADIMQNITTRGTASAQNYTQQSKSNTKTTLDMNDFLQLLVKQLQNQDMMNPMKESEFMAQMTQMATVEAMNTFTEISITQYAASLVGKEVTVGEVDNKGELTEIFGTVTGSGVYGGERVIFVNDKIYYLNQIMAVGKLPPKEEEEKPEVPDPEVPDPEVPDPEVPDPEESRKI